MSITKANVLSYVNEQLNRSETDIDTELQDILDDLCRGPYIEARDTSQTVAVGSTELAKPTLCYRDMIISIVLNDGSNDLPPLKEFPGGFKAYSDLMGDAGVVFVSNPTHWTMWRDIIYLWPTVGQSYTSVIDYYKQHGTDLDSIEFSDDWRRAINYGVTRNVALKRKMPDMFNVYAAQYKDEKERQRRAYPGHPNIVGT